MIVGLVAAIRPVSFDMSKPLPVDVTCGSFNLTVRAERNRCGYNLNTVKSPMLCIGKCAKITTQTNTSFTIIFTAKHDLRSHKPFGLNICPSIKGCKQRRHLIWNKTAKNATPNLRVHLRRRFRLIRAVSYWFRVGEFQAPTATASKLEMEVKHHGKRICLEATLR